MKQKVDEKNKISNGFKKMIAIYIAIIFFIGPDRFLKTLAIARPDRQINLIGEILRFDFKANYYIAFSLPLAGEFLAVAIGLVIIALVVVLAYYGFRYEDNKLVSLGLIIMGASSNLFDRIKYGYVVDYLDLKYFTVFNLADAMIVAGVIIFIIFSYKK